MSRSGIAATLAVAGTVAVAVPTHAEIIIVPDDYASIQAAIDDAFAGDVIRVRPGTYIGNIDFLGKAITVESMDGPEVTIVDAGGGVSPCCEANPDGLPGCSGDAECEALVCAVDPFCCDAIWDETCAGLAGDPIVTTALASGRSAATASIAVPPRLWPIRSAGASCSLRR